ncbi:MAG: hypothetical protein JWM80_2156, partial [Cyanobacteria bacterium RYN_339]|nr:hypothetical protein [Cyanobacteria bacterium RYN_339]
FGLTLMLALVACGCTALPPVLPPAANKAPQTSPATKAGQVVVDVAQVMAFLEKRHVLAAGFGTTGITNLKLTARGPGMSTVTSGLLAFSNPPSGSLTLEVPQGPNRVFRLQGVDASGNVLASLVTLANVPGADPVALSFDLATTAAGYTLSRLLEPLEPGQTDAGVAAVLETTDITGDLKAFVLKATGYNATTNKVGAGLVDPRFFRANRLVKLLRANGVSMLKPRVVEGNTEATIQVPSSPDSSDLTHGTAGKLYIAFRSAAGLPITNAPLKAVVYDLGTTSSSGNGTDDSGSLTVTEVGVGTVDIKLTLPDQSEAWLHDITSATTAPLT